MRGESRFRNCASTDGNTGIRDGRSDVAHAVVLILETGWGVQDSETSKHLLDRFGRSNDDALLIVTR
jgi:hypothetical protein